MREPLALQALELTVKAPCVLFLDRWLYYRAPEWVFTAAYVAWAVATLTLRFVRPR